MDLVDMMATIWKSKWIILITALVAVALVTFQTLRENVFYKADAMLAVGDLGLGHIETEFTQLDDDRLASDYRELLMTKEVLQKSIDDTGLNMAPAQLRSRITANTSKDSPYIKLSAIDTNAESAVSEVNAAANGLTAYITALQIKNSNEGKQNVLTEMARVENEMIAIGNTPVQTRDQGRITALQTARQSLIKEYEGFVLGTNSQMLNIVSLADGAIASTKHTVRNSLFGLLAGFVAGIAIGFITDSVRKAIKRG